MDEFMSGEQIAQGLRAAMEDFQSAFTPEPGDYQQEGVWYCGKCKTPRQRYSKVLADVGNGYFPTECACRKAAIEQEDKARKDAEFLERMDALRAKRITNKAYHAFTFDKDDRRNERISRLCERYVQEFPKMRESNIGILFYGDKGTGKTFYACCIANALIDQRIFTTVTSMPRILGNIGSAFENAQAFIDNLRFYDLLVIDDFGVERDTAYAIEQLYNVIDTRAHAGKPTIITTNMSISDMRNEPRIEYARIYDRVLGMCPVQVKMAGESRRQGVAEKKKREALRILDV